MSQILKSSSTRIKTGILLMGVVSLVAFLNSTMVFWIFFGFLGFIAMYEASKLYGYYDNKIYGYFIVIWIMAFFYPKPEDIGILTLMILASKLAYKRTLDEKVILLILYPTIPFLALFSLYVNYGLTALFWLLIVVAATDIGAYFVGKTIGKTKFSETSPNKTLEGVIGGIAIAVILSTIFSIGDYTIIEVICISFLVSIASIFGDLFESHLKRQADVKDSGNIFPGHGGVLDRLDGYFFGGIVLLFALRALY